MVNYNGQIYSEDNPIFGEENRSFRYGDGLFETIRTLGESINFWEDHYLRLMSSMRILRMEIPMTFTMEFLASEIVKLLSAKSLEKNASRVRLSVFRNDGGKYSPLTNEISYVISAEPLNDPFFVSNTDPYRIELFKEHHLNTGLLSTLKTSNRILNVVGSVYANENKVDNYVLLNHKKHLVEALSGNIFLVQGNTLYTPPLEDGCINGIIRKKVLEICKSGEEYKAVEQSISPFELQKADEIFFTNAIIGIRSVTHYRRKEYGNAIAKNLLGKLNAQVRLT